MDKRESQEPLKTTTTVSHRGESKPRHPSAHSKAADDTAANCDPDKKSATSKRRSLVLDSNMNFSSTQQQQKPPQLATKTSSLDEEEEEEDEQSGFVKVDKLGLSAVSGSSEALPSFKPTITAKTTYSLAADDRTAANDNDNYNDNDNDSKSSDEEISDVLDETEIQLIEAMEDAPSTPRTSDYNEDNGDSVSRPASVPLDSVEFVAPGVTKQTAMSLLRRALDIEGPVIQQKMVEFLLIDGVIASLIGFITHCQGSIYSPSSTTSQTAPCSPSLNHGSINSFNRQISPAILRTSDKKDGHHHHHSLPVSVLQEFEHRNQHRARLQRQRNRSAGLSETDLRRAYNAVQMLINRDQYARKVLDTKLAVIVPCLMAVFHKDSLGSFHHVCLLLERCFFISPLKTTRLLCYAQNPPSRWWTFSESVARGNAPICDILPYLSEPCVQQLFLKAEFGVWTGRLMASLNLSPNDALFAPNDQQDSNNIMPLAKSQRNPEDNSSNNSQLRNKSMQLVRNRFKQLNNGGFLDQILDLIEDSDPHISECVAEFIAFMINDCSGFYGFNLLFKPIYESAVPVRRLAQMIVNSSSQRLSHRAKAAIRILYALLSKTSCQYGLRARNAQGIPGPQLQPRGSRVLLQVGQAARSALESFLPGLFATVTGLQRSTDLTSHSTYNRRASIESLSLPEYEEADPDFDTDDTETESSDIEANDDDRDGDEDEDLRQSAAALLHLHGPAYPTESNRSSGSISSSLSPSSTLSASPLAAASSTPEQPAEMYIGEGMDAEDLGILVSLPKPDIHRLNLLRLCVEVLRETANIDELVGWIDIRVWRALSAWFLNHPHNNILHMVVYQLISIVTLETVRLRQVYRQSSGARPSLHASLSFPQSASTSKSGPFSGESTASDLLSSGGRQQHLPRSSSAKDATAQKTTPFVSSEERRGTTAKRRARRRRIMADRTRREESTNCDNILTYLIEQNQWVDKLIKRALLPNSDGAHGYILLILNTLRLAVQVDRRRCIVVGYTNKGMGKMSSTSKQPSDSLDDVSVDILPESESDLGCEEEDSLIPDMAYHDPEMRKRLAEYPLYRLQRWEISLLYSPVFRAHLRSLRQQATCMAKKLDEFKLCDQAKNEIIGGNDDGRNSSRGIASSPSRPIPFFSPQKIKPPASLDNTEIKRRQMSISVGLLLGIKSGNIGGPSSPIKKATKQSDDNEIGVQEETIDEVGIDINSLFARMLGFTEDMVDLVTPRTPSSTLDTEKTVDGDTSKHPTQSSSSTTVAATTNTSNSNTQASMSGLFEDISSKEVIDAAEVLCSALTSKDTTGGGNKHHHGVAAGLRTRKKGTMASTGTARRRRARLGNKLSNSSLGGTVSTVSSSPSSSSSSSSAAAILLSSPTVNTIAAKAKTISTGKLVDHPATSELTDSMQSLDI